MELCRGFTKSDRIGICQCLILLELCLVSSLLLVGLGIKC